MTTLTLEQANRIIEAALAEARRRAFPPLAVVVLDAAGHVRALQRDDGCGIFRAEIATGKAWTAVSMGISSRKVGESARNLAHFFIPLAATAQGKFLPHTGAVAIRDKNGELMGAVGASGAVGDDDEAVCLAGVAAVGLDAQ